MYPSDLGALLTVLAPRPAPHPHRTPRIDPLTEQPAAIVVFAARRAASAQGIFPLRSSYLTLLQTLIMIRPQSSGSPPRAGASVTCRKGVRLRNIAETQLVTTPQASSTNSWATAGGVGEVHI